MNIDLRIEKQTIKNLGTSVVSDSVDYVTAAFSFSADWNGTVKTAVFRGPDEIPYSVIIPDTGKVIVPFEVIKAPSFTVSVFGNKDTMRITTRIASVTVTPSGYEKGETPSDPTPDVYEQLVTLCEKSAAKAKEAENIAKSVREDADNGKFNGKQGEAGPQGPKGEQGDVSKDYVDTIKENLNQKIDTEMFRAARSEKILTDDLAAEATERKSDVADITAELAEKSTEISDLRNTAESLDRDLKAEISARESADTVIETNLGNLRIATNTSLADRYKKSETYNREEVDQKVAGAFKFKGEVESYDKLPKNTEEGDVYQIGDKEYAWNGKSWVELGFNVDLTAYIKTVDAESKIATAKEEAVNTSKSYTDTKIQGEATARQNAEKALQENIDGKVDKFTSSDTYRLYATGSSEQGTIKTLKYSYGIGGSTVPVRQGNGNLGTNDPVLDTDATPKSYVDNADALKMNKSAFDYNDTTKTLTIDIF